MIKAARDVLVRTLKGDSDLFAIVGGRVYPSDVATIRNPTYPCATTSFRGGVPDNFITDLGDSTCIIQTYSTKSYSQCWDMYEKIKSALAFGIFSDSDVRIRTTEDVMPIERYDEEARVFIVTSNWNVFMIGA